VEAAAASRCQEREEGGWRMRGLTLGAGLVRPRWGKGEEVSLGAGRGFGLEGWKGEHTGGIVDDGGGNFLRCRSVLKGCLLNRC